MNPQKVIKAENLEQTLTTAVNECEHDKIFILADETTKKLCRIMGAWQAPRPSPSEPPTPTRHSSRSRMSGRNWDGPVPPVTPY